MIDAPTGMDSMDVYAGLKNGKDGYEGLIEAALAISGLLSVDQQWKTVATALERAFPSYILTMASTFYTP